MNERAEAPPQKLPFMLLSLEDSEPGTSEPWELKGQRSKVRPSGTSTRRSSHLHPGVPRAPRRQTLCSSAAGLGSTLAAAATPSSKKQMPWEPGYLEQGLHLLLQHQERLECTSPHLLAAPDLGMRPGDAAGHVPSAAIHHSGSVSHA